MALTAYNGYRCDADRRRLFEPWELEWMREADAVIEAEFAVRGKRQKPVIPKASKPLTPEQRERKRARDRAYVEAHRYEINVRQREYCAARREQQRETCRAYYAAHRDVMNARRTQYDQTHQHQRRERQNLRNQEKRPADAATSKGAEENRQTDCITTAPSAQGGSYDR